LEIRVKPIGSERVVAETWNATIAKKKLTEFIFADFLNKAKYSDELEGIKKYNRKYKPKTVDRNTKGTKGYTKTEFVTIYKQAIEKIEDESIGKLLEDGKIQLNEDMTEFMNSKKGEELKKLSISELVGDTLGELFEDTELSRKAEMKLERGLTTAEVDEYFTDRIEVENRKGFRIFKLDGMELFGKRNNIKYQTLKKLGFKNIGLSTAGGDEGKSEGSVFGSGDGRLPLNEIGEVFAPAGKYKFNDKKDLDSARPISTAARFPRQVKDVKDIQVAEDTQGKGPVKVPMKQMRTPDFSAKNQVVDLSSKTGEILSTIPDTLFILYGGKWEQENKEDVKRYRQLSQPLREMKPVLESYRRYLIKLFKDEYGEDLDDVTDKEKEEFLTKIKRTKFGDNSTEKQLRERMAKIAGVDTYATHSLVLNNFIMVGNREEKDLLSSLTTPDEYKVNIDNLEVLDKLKEIRIAKREYIEQQINELESDEIRDDTRKKLAEGKLTNFAEEIYNGEKTLIDLFGNLLRDLNKVYNIQIVIKATETKSGTNYAIKSPKKGPKSFVFSKKILLDRYGSKVAERTPESEKKPKGQYIKIAKVKKFINEIKRELAIIKL
tara:strand:+ start:10618 stop:12432 length:1815 start_codon:yes stop_codon:yes gene_type:complete